ncbi:MAG: FemAB family XrtA/PEP-CTERM system-associated protein [Pontixanthobacter sp.]
MNAPFYKRTASITEANLSDRDEVAALEAFVEGEGGSLFHRPAWLRAVETGTGQEARGLVAQHGGAMVGWLPFTLCHSPLFGRAMISSGFGVGGGVLAAHTATAMALGEAAQNLAHRLSCDTIELRGGTVAEGWNTVTDSHCGFVRDLADDDEAQLLAIPRKQRAEIRKSLKQDFQVSIGSSKDDRAAHYEVYAQSVHNLGTPVFPRRLFDAMGDTFRETSDILTVRDGDIPVASVLSFYHDGAVMPYWGGGTRAARHLRANERMYFELMLHARRRNMQRFDFGRSKTGSGPYAYKKNWGFSSRPLKYAYWTQPGGKPRDLSPANDAYARKIAVWKRLPLSVANRLGPHIAKGLA